MRLRSNVGRECEGQFNLFCNAGDKLLICLSYKVKYFGKVANV